MTKRQKGAAHLILIVAVIGAAIAAVGFFALKKGGLPVSTPTIPGVTQKATEADFSFIEDPLVRKHYTAQENVESYRTKTNTPPLQGVKAIVNYTEVQKSGENLNRYDWQEVDGKKEAEIITIGDTVYVKDYSDNSWWKQVFKPEELEEEESNELTPEDPVDTVNLPKITHTKLGEEACGNLFCYKYEERLKDMAQSRIIWFGKNDFLLRKDEMAVGGVKVSNEYSYDDINIKPPSPTKDVPEGKSIYDYLSYPSQQMPVQTSYPTSGEGPEEFNPEDYNLQDFNPGNYEQ